MDAARNYEEANFGAKEAKKTRTHDKDATDAERKRASDHHFNDN